MENRTYTRVIFDKLLRDNIVFNLLDKLYNPNILYRSTGVILDTFVSNNEAQMSLFSDDTADEKKAKLSKCFDKLEARFGKDIIQTGFVKKDV